MTTKNKNAKKSFEESLAALEETVEKLEEGDLTLDDALTCFEEGVGFIKNCENHLHRAKGKLAQLLKDENGEFYMKEFEDFITK